MPKQVRLRRGTTVQHSTFTRADGELTVDTTKKTIVLHDGVTAGGKPFDGFVKLTPSAVLTSQTIAGPLQSPLPEQSHADTSGAGKRIAKDMRCLLRSSGSSKPPSGRGTAAKRFISSRLQVRPGASREQPEPHTPFKYKSVSAA